MAKWDVQAVLIDMIMRRLRAGLPVHQELWAAYLTTLPQTEASSRYGNAAHADIEGVQRCTIEVDVCSPSS